VTFACPVEVATLDEFEVNKLCDELAALIEHEPGDNPDALSRAQTLIETLRSTDSGGYINERLSRLSYGFEQWFSVDKWNRQNDDGQLVKRYLEDDLICLRVVLWSKSQDNRNWQD
jgi:hypothetical protein